MNKTISPALIIISIILVLTLYKTGFLASFITTCNNIEPDNTEDFKEILASYNYTSTNAATSITYDEVTPNSTIVHELQGTSYSNGLLKFSLYDTDMSCTKVIDYLLIGEELRIDNIFKPEIIRPDYDSAITYYDSNHVALTSPPIVGSDYYKLVGTDYVKMPVPYESTPPTLKNNPYQIYTPINYKEFEGKMINNVLYWCSNNDKTLIRVDNNPYDSINAYAKIFVVCETVWVNDTEKLMDECLSNQGIWEEEGTCTCPDKEYTGTTCEETSSGSGGLSNTGTTITESSSTTTTFKDFLSDKSLIIGIIIVVVLVALIIYGSFKGKKRRR